MALFSYRGRSATGELVSGSIDAATADSVATQLQGRGIIPLAIEAASPGATLRLPRRRKRVSVEDLIMFSRQMYSLNRSGVAINRAMRSLAESTRNERLRDALTEVESSLNSGMNLSSALRRHPDVFDALYVNIVQVGENSGQLDEIFRQLALYLERDRDTRRRIAAALRYPMLVMIAIAIAVAILNLFVIPVFADLFSRFSAELPLPTRILIWMSDAFVAWWHLIAVAVVLSVIAVHRWLATEAGRLRWDRVKLKLPIVGGIVERSVLARYGRSFSLMLRSGVPLIQALDHCSRAVGNSWLGVKIREMRGGVERGESLLRTASRSGMFTPLVLQMIAVGEETGQVDELLDEIAEFYEQEVDYEVRNLSAVLEPILILAMAGLVAVLALGIFLPMWDMYSVMQR